MLAARQVVHWIQHLALPITSVEFLLLDCTLFRCSTCSKNIPLKKKKKTSCVVRMHVAETGWHQISCYSVSRMWDFLWGVYQGFGCATADQHSCFNQLTNRRVRFSSCSYASLPGETTSVFNRFKSPCRSEKQKASSRVIDLVHKKTHQNFWQKYIYICRNIYVHCTINAERPACEVQHLLLQFLGLFCRPWRNVWRRTTYQLEVSHQQRKSDADRKYAEDFPFYGFWGAVFTAFWHNSSGDSFHKFLCSAQQPIMTSVLAQKRIAKEDHICTLRSNS